MEQGTETTWERGGAGPRLVIVSGLPGAGKTTHARRLEEAIPAFRLSSDDWLAGLGVNLWDGAVRDRVEGLQRAVCMRLLALGV